MTMDDVKLGRASVNLSEHGEVGGQRILTMRVEAECLGACGFPTVVQINDRYYENVTPADVPAILASLDGGEE